MDEIEQLKDIWFDKKNPSQMKEIKEEIASKILEGFYPDGKLPKSGPRLILLNMQCFRAAENVQALMDKRVREEIEKERIKFTDWLREHFDPDDCIEFSDEDCVSQVKLVGFVFADDEYWQTIEALEKGGKQ